MPDQERVDLSKHRIEKSAEMLSDAEELLKTESY